jgi:hypothetical protein
MVMTSISWLIHFTDRDSEVTTFSPEVTHAEALDCYPDAVAAEPTPDLLQRCGAFNTKVKS